MANLITTVTLCASRCIRVKALIDTGAEETVITTAAAKRVKAKRAKSTHHNGRFIRRVQMHLSTRSCGMSMGTVGVDSWKRLELPDGVDVLLGLDYLRGRGATVNARSGRLSCRR